MLYGRPTVQPRAIAAYVTSPHLSASYSGHHVEMHYPYPPILAHIQEEVSRILGVGFDHIMLNWYKDGNVAIGKHRDTKQNQVIASLSLGAERRFSMSPFVSKAKTGKGKAKKRETDGCEDVEWVLENGSLLVMQGSTQENWKVSLHNTIPNP